MTVILLTRGQPQSRHRLLETLDPSVRVIRKDPLGFAEQFFECLDKCLVFFGVCLIKMDLNSN